MFEFLQYNFMIRALAAGIVVALTAPAIGTFLVVRRYSLMADTLSHSALLGAAIGIFFSINPFAAAAVLAVAAGIGIERLRSMTLLSGDSILALFLSGSVAAAVVLASAARGLNVNFLPLLFGSISTVSRSDLIVIASLGAASLLTIALLYKEFFLISLSNEIAEAGGIKTRALNTLLMVLSAVCVSVSMKIVGALLIGALMVIPVAAALSWRKGFLGTILIAVCFSVLSVIGGIVLSFYFGLASGGTIVLFTLATFAVSVLLNEKKVLG